ncbi:MAG: DUF3052 family protein [Gemmatimonadales bacterium]
MNREIRLFHWNEREVPERVARLQRVGYRVDAQVFRADELRELAFAAPDAIVIDLGRIPSRGRDLGVALRTRAGTRSVPLVFVGGKPPKLDSVRRLIPDATYCSWRGIKGALQKAISSPPTDPHVPAGAMAAYAGKPLAKKLGLKPGCSVALVGAPESFDKLLLRSGEDLVIRNDIRAPTDLTLWFVTRESELLRRLDTMKRRAVNGGLWIVWPKRGSGIESSLTQATVRKPAMDAGLVDFKVASIDETWTGLRFTLRES